MNFETLPDELLLDICRYLSSTDVLYSFYNLNSRFNRTISIYYQHVILRQTSFTEFNWICSNILPEIGSNILSLCVNANWTDLLARQFYFYFGKQMKEIFPRLEHFILVAFSGNELDDYLRSISDQPSLTKLTVIDRYNVTEEYKHILFERILSANQFRLKIIQFNRHSESLSINLNHSIIYPNLIQLNIHLEKIFDLCILLKLIPNIEKISVVIHRRIDDEKIEFPSIILQSLFEFHLESTGRSWSFDEIHSLLQSMPYLTTLSFDILSPDLRLLDGQLITSIYPINNLHCFNYVVKCSSKHEIPSIDTIVSSWLSTKYSICCLIDDYRKHLFLHTNPYRYSYLEISSLFFKHMNKQTKNYRDFIKELLVFHIHKFEEIFPILNNCNRIKDLAMEIDEPTSSTEQLSQSNVKLSLLPNLRWISIDGIPTDLHRMKEILESSPSLSMLIITMKYFLRLIDEETCLSIIQTRIKHLSIQFNDENDLYSNHIERLSQVFSNVRHLIVEHKINEIDIEKSLFEFLKYFENHRLISMIIRGRTTEQLRVHPSEWLFERIPNLRKPFQVDYMSHVISNVIDIGLRMYGNGSTYSKESVKFIEEICRRRIREYFLEHQQLTNEKRMLYLQTIVYRLRKKRVGLKRLEQYLQAKDRPTTTTQDEQFVKEKKLTLHERFNRITRQLQLDHQLLITPSLDRQRSRQYARLDAFYKSDQLTSNEYLTFVEQQHQSFNNLRLLSPIDIQHWLKLNHFPVIHHDLSLAEICLFFIKEILLEFMDEIHSNSSLPCDFSDVLRRKHLSRRCSFTGRQQRS